MTMLPFFFGQVEAHHDDVLAVGGARGEGDLARGGVDERAEALLQIGLPVVAEVDAAGPGPMQAVLQPLGDRTRREAAHGMERRRVHVGLDRGQRKLVAHRRREDGARAWGRLTRERAAARYGQGAGARQELTTSDRTHGHSSPGITTGAPPGVRARKSPPIMARRAALRHARLAPAGR